MSNARIRYPSWLVLLAWLAATPTLGTADPAPDLLPLVQQMLPGSLSLAPLAPGSPFLRIRGADGILGHAVRTGQTRPIPAYSGKPIDALVVVDNQGNIRGVRILSHQEPILVVGIGEEDLTRFTDQYRGASAAAQFRVGGPPQPGRVVVDSLSGATITAMVLNSSISGAAADLQEQLGQATSLTPAEPPPWVGIWAQRQLDIALLSAGLIALLVLLLFQDWLVRRPSRVAWVQNAYLLFTLVFIGWYGLAQLSIVNVLTFTQALFSGFKWESFLLDPFLFCLWAFVAFTVLLWGRGVYCGWLCPFGALQELGYRLARRLGLPAWELPPMVHERLTALKYLILVGLVGLSLHSLPLVELAAEVEPFKTVFVLRFDRSWPFVLYALALLLVTLFVRKAYCRYLCPLGAALSFPSRLRIFDWLRRRKECGRPCQACARECGIHAIRPTGEINALECHHCLDCQVTYWNDHKCPPLAERRVKNERRLHLKLAALQESLPQAKKATGQAQYPE